MEAPWLVFVLRKYESFNTHLYEITISYPVLPRPVLECVSVVVAGAGGTEGEAWGHAHYIPHTCQHSLTLTPFHVDMR